MTGMKETLVSWPLLVAANVVCTVVRHIYHHPFNLVAGMAKRLQKSISSWDDDLDFSGLSVEDGKWRVWITATFDHANSSHVVNNMIMLLSFVPQLEWLLVHAVSAAVADGTGQSGGSHLGGALLLWLLFVCTGAAGWLVTLVALRRRHKGDEWTFAARYQVSLGSSPATYGMLAFLAVASPNCCVCSTFGMPAWIWVTALICAPQAFNEKYGVQWWRRPATRPDALSTMSTSTKGQARYEKQQQQQQQQQQSLSVMQCRRWNWRCPIFIMASSLFGWLIFRPIFGKECAVSAVGYCIIYIAYAVLYKAADVVLLRRPVLAPSSDHACHVGGFVCGAFLGGLLQVFGLAEGAWRNIQSGSMGVPASLASVGGVIIVLVVRFLIDV